MNRWVFFGASILASAMICFLIWAFGSDWARTQEGLPQQQTQEIQEKKIRYIIGDLGGMPVKIPRYFADWVEYNDSTGWAGVMSGEYKPPPPRTQSSKLMSFGFKVRYPDMAGFSTPELQREFESRSIYDTAWIDVGITTGKQFPGSGFLDRLANTINSPGRPFQYVERTKDTQTVPGLILFVAEGIDQKTKIPYRLDRNTDDIYFYRNPDGQVSTYINCSNRPHEAAPCSHKFSLEPNANAWITVGYRRGLISEWKSIQKSVTHLILSFNSKQKTMGEKSTASSTPSSKN